MMKALLVVVLLSIVGCSSVSKLDHDSAVVPVPKKGSGHVIGVLYESKNAERRVPSGESKTFGLPCSTGQVIGGGYSGIEVTGHISIDDVRVIASYPTETNNSWVLHLRNVGTPSAGAAPKVSVLVSVACLEGI